MTLDIEGVLAGHVLHALSWTGRDGRAEWSAECLAECGWADRGPGKFPHAAVAHRAHVAAVLREQIAEDIEAEADRAHAAFASDEDDHLADMKTRLGIDLEPGHWNRHDDGCSMCGMAGAARIVRAAQVAPSRVPGEET